MSIADSVRDTPQRFVIETNPGRDNSWVKRVFMAEKRDEKIQDSFEDFGWVVADLGAGGEW